MLKQYFFFSRSNDEVRRSRSRRSAGVKRQMWPIKPFQVASVHLKKWEVWFSRFKECVTRKDGLRGRDLRIIYHWYMEQLEILCWVRGLDVIMSRSLMNWLADIALLNKGGLWELSSATMNGWLQKMFRTLLFIQKCCMIKHTQTVVEKQGEKICWED